MWRRASRPRCSAAQVEEGAKSAAFGGAGLSPCRVRPTLFASVQECRGGFTPPVLFYGLWSATLRVSVASALLPWPSGAANGLDLVKIHEVVEREAESQRNIRKSCSRVIQKIVLQSDRSDAVELNCRSASENSVLIYAHVRRREEFDACCVTQQYVARKARCCLDQDSHGRFRHRVA